MASINDYINERIEEIDEEDLSSEELKQIADEVKHTFNTQCKCFYAGGFDSPGYDLDCYVISYIDENNELQAISIEIPRF